MGSLIKSPGGTIVSSGGYIAGRADLVAAAAARLTTPGVGTDAGSVSGETLRLTAQGTTLPFPAQRHRAHGSSAWDAVQQGDLACPRLIGLLDAVY